MTLYYGHGCGGRKLRTAPCTRFGAVTVKDVVTWGRWAKPEPGVAKRTIKKRKSYWTVTTTSPVTPSATAEIVELPGATACTTPPELMVATEVVDEAQTTLLVMSRVDPSLKVPVAVKL